MAQITTEELLKIAKISKLAFDEQEIQSLVGQVDAVLHYASCVKEAAAVMDLPSSKRINVFREDVVIPTDNKPILQQAPEHEQNYFVVPMIIEK